MTYNFHKTVSADLRTFSHYKSKAIKYSLRPLIALVFLIFMALPSVAKNSARSPVVIEMFTSQACPTCPAVEKMLQPLIPRDDVIVLMCHVDYFNKKQAPLGRGFCTKKQTAYIERFNKNTHYTPHVMMNGHIDAPLAADGDLPTPLKAAIEEQIARIEIKKTTSEGFEYILPNMQNITPDKVDVWLAAFDVPIKASTPRGRGVTYYNVVRTLSPLDGWTAGGALNVLNMKVGKSQKGFAIFVQNKTDGRIIAAGKFKT